MLVASAPQFCHGIVDPIKEISDLALSKGLPLHVDACFGGYMLPWYVHDEVHIKFLVFCHIYPKYFTRMDIQNIG